MAQKFCSSCGQKVSEPAKFCPHCGANLAGGTNKATPPRKATGFRDTIIIVGALALIAVAYFILRDPESPPQPPQNESAGTFAHPNVGGMDSSAMGVLNSLPVDFNSLVELGHQNMDAGNYAVAAECYRRALAIDGSSLDLRTDYGACLHFMALPDRAIEEFRTVLKQNPNHPIANFNMGIVYYNENKNDSAEFYWNKYLTIDPNGSASETARKLLKEIGG